MKEYHIVKKQDNLMDISQLIRLPESKTLEFKRDTSSLEPILKCIVAFANTAGGIVVIGIEDDGTIVGIKYPTKVQEQLTNTIAHRIRPQLLLDFHIVDYEKKWLLAIQVDYFPAPYYLSDKGEAQGVYVRLGNSNRLASEEVVTEIKRHHQRPFFDKEACYGVSEADLDALLIRTTFSKKHVAIDTAKLLSLGVLTKQGKQWYATNGGVILFGKAEIRQEYFPFAEVRCARFSGTTRAEFIDRLNIEGGMLAAVEEVPKFIRRNTKMAGKFGGMQRRDIPEYSVEGIREALTNALVHANYEVPGTRIFVAIYDDKLEIQNPGIMPPGMSLEQFKAGVSRIRNPVIARVFGELGLVEEWGSGYKRIKDACEKGGYPEPRWEELGNVLRVTFYPHPDIQKDQVETKSGLSPDQVGIKDKLDPQSQRILGLCERPKSIIELMQALQWKNRTKFRQKYMTPLLQAGWLCMTIPDKPRSVRQQYQSMQPRMKDQVETKSGLSPDQVGIKDKLDPQSQRILELCEQPKSIIELMQALQWKNRTKFRQKYITPLLQAGWLCMTIPDKPHSARQQYQSMLSEIEEIKTC